MNEYRVFQAVKGDCDFDVNFRAQDYVLLRKSINNMEGICCMISTKNYNNSMFINVYDTSKCRKNIRKKRLKVTKVSGAGPRTPCLLFALLHFPKFL